MAGWLLNLPLTPKGTPANGTNFSHLALNGVMGPARTIAAKPTPFVLTLRDRDFTLTLRDRDCTLTLRDRDFTLTLRDRPR